jgi:HPt (histidine-containing phosphotransfer) domain-containing protein
VRLRDSTLVLDRDQLREVTLEDGDLMRELLSALIDETTRQIKLLGMAIEDQDATRCARLAHYSRGACANLGANRAAALLEAMEEHAAAGSVARCGVQLARLADEVERLKSEKV